ncbi:unnamed protein product [Chilo suppressalis]|uniref:DUF659 domain-containing protein n=1 Tax=Chilo suppressalis TaxID=168631 RepID=A0ABN8AP95_CHISP|nr:unnamed protein product [Chilo suppressalis]
MKDSANLRFIPGYEPPSRKTISSSLIPALYVQKRNECISMVQNEAESVCITTDCWTSSLNESFIAVTAHYITKYFDSRSILLECRSFPGNHTSHNLAEELRVITKEWNLSNKILFAVSDNASNICNAIQIELK